MTDSMKKHMAAKHEIWEKYKKKTPNDGKMRKKCANPTKCVNR